MIEAVSLRGAFFSDARPADSNDGGPYKNGEAILKDCELLRVPGMRAFAKNARNDTVLCIVLGILLATALPAQAQDGVFVYDDHGKRDPFGPLVTNSGAVVVSDTDLTVADMNLEGLVSDPQGNNVAIINGKIVKAGDHVGSYKVDTVAVDYVELLKEQQHITLRLKKGGT